MLSTKVVILNWNGAKFLAQFLPRVVETMPEWASVVVVDNGSTDSSQSVVESVGGAEWLPLDDNYGYAGGYNRALARLEGDVFVLLNSDVEPAEGWLEPLVEHLEANRNVGALQPKIRSWAARDYFEYAGAAGGRIDKYGYPFCRGRVMNRVEKDEGQYDNVEPIFWASGACLVVRAGVWRKMGGLDESFFAHMEEIDLCWRMQLMGYTIECEPRSVVYHVGGGTLPNNSPRKIYFNFRNTLLMMHKCLPEGQRWRLTQRRAMDWLSWGVYVLSGRWAYARAVARAHRDYRRQRRELDGKRAELWRNVVCPEPATIYPKWMVWHYFIGGRKRSSELK